MGTDHTQPQEPSVSANPMRKIRRVLIVLTIITIVILLISIPIIEALEKQREALEKQRIEALKNQGWTSYPENNTFRDLTYDSKGNLWAGTDQGLKMLAQDGSWTPHNGLYNSVSIRVLIFDEKGNLWAGGDKGLSMMTPDGKWTNYSKDNSDLVSSDIFVLIFDKKGNLWVGGDGGLNMLTPDGRWTTYTTTNSGLNNDRIYALAFDENETLWIGTYLGISSLSPQGSWLTYTTTNSGLSDDFITALVFDEKGNLWIGTFFRGLSRLDPAGNWRDYSTYTRIREDMIFDEKDNLLIATAEGVGRLTPDGQGITYTTTNSGLNSDDVFALVFDEKGNLWIGDSSGVSKLDAEGMGPINADPAPPSIRPMINVLLISAMFFLIIVVIWPFTLVKKLPTISDKVEEPTTASVDSSKPAIKRQKSWTQWILPIVIALVLAVWTIWGALFFLAVAWVLRMDPKPYSRVVPSPSDLDKDSVKGTYTWLLISPVLTIPTMIFAAQILGDSNNNLVLAALVPLVFHTPFLFRLNSKSIFVYRHAQLAILLVALRAGMAALSLSMGYSWGLFLIGNGSLWLFGTTWARNQVVRGECWLMQRKGERIILPESTEPENAHTPIVDKELDDMLKSLDAQGILAAKQKALHAFRTGTPKIKKRAVEVLSKLGEVEKF